MQLSVLPSEVGARPAEARCGRKAGRSHLSTASGAVDPPATASLLLCNRAQPCRVAADGGIPGDYGHGAREIWACPCTLDTVCWTSEHCTLAKHVQTDKQDQGSLAPASLEGFLSSHQKSPVARARQPMCAEAADRAPSAKWRWSRSAIKGAAGCRHGKYCRCFPSLSNLRGSTSSSSRGPESNTYEREQSMASPPE